MNMNPLHQPRPHAADCIYVGKFAIANESCTYVGSFSSYHVHLTKQFMWLSDELCIPIKSISSYIMQTRGRLIRRHALEIIYRNPISKNMEAVFLCDIDLIGFYHEKALLFLTTQIDEVIAAIVAIELQNPPEGTENPIKQQSGCETCRNPEAFYVSYQFSMGALVFWYMSQERRFLHCKRHILLHGAPSYLVTVLFGWLGVCIIAYPVIVYKQAMNLKPLLGKSAYLLAFGPTIAVVLFVAHRFGAF